jgi:hypothetical protein
MITRRTLLQSAGAGTLGAAAIPAAAAPPETRKFSGPHGMPHNLTLLSIRNADGSESLGVKLESGILDVRAAAKKLNLPAPDTLDQLLAGKPRPRTDQPGRRGPEGQDPAAGGERHHPWQAVLASGQDHLCRD